MRALALNGILIEKDLQLRKPTKDFREAIFIVNSRSFTPSNNRV